MARGTYGGALDPNLFKVNLLFLMGTSKCQTGFKLRDVAVQDNSPQDVADQCLTLLQDPMRALLGQTDSFIGIDVLKIGTDEGAWAPSTVLPGARIVGGGAEQPNFMSINVALKSEIRKRYGQGRMFLPTVHQDDVDGNVLSTSGLTWPTSFVTVLQDNFMGDPATHDLILVNSHPALPQIGAPGTPGYRAALPPSWYDVVSIRINAVVTSLRSRKAGVGS